MSRIHNSNCEATASLPVSQNRLPIVFALLALSVFINYIDRGNLSIAAPMLKDELHLSGSQLGILLSSFFWTYGMFLVLSGWLVDRLNASWVILVERRGRVTESGSTWVNWQQEEPDDLGGRRQPSTGGTSRVTGDGQARICERLGAKFPGPTRRQETEPSQTGLR